MHLSIVIPCHNEAGRIEQTLQKIDSFMRAYAHAYAKQGEQETDRDYEIIAVENGSSDSTSELLRQNLSKIKGLSYIHSKKGKGHAIKKGVEVARGDFILITDADNSTDISYLKDMFEKMFADSGPSHENDSVRPADIVNSSRRLANSFVSHKQGLLRRVCGGLFHASVKVLFNLPVSDTQNGFKLFKSEPARAIYREIKTTGWVTEVELFSIAKKMGFKIAEIPVAWKDEEGSKLTLKDAPGIAWDLMKLWVRS